MGEGEDVASIEDRTIDAVRSSCRSASTAPTASSTDAAPTLVFYHGGGFVLGGLASHDRDCRALANRGQCLVIAVDYRLAPEHPFPAAAEDAVAALEYVVVHAAELGVDVDHLAVGGDSAGGNLAAVTALHARDAGIPLKLQLLIYPAVAGEEGDFPSRVENATGYMLDQESITWFTAAYFPEGAPQRLAGGADARRQPRGRRPGAGHHGRVRPAARRGRGLRGEAARRPASRRRPAATTA